MPVIGEQIPICGYCDLKSPCLSMDETAAREARGQAVDSYYNDRLQPWDVDPALQEKGLGIEEARCAVECLHRLMRKTCATANVSISEPGKRGLTTKKLN